MRDPVTSRDRQKWIADAEERGEVADSMKVRMEIMARIKSGVVTLAEGQAELRKVIRNAKKHGKVTRNQAWHGRTVERANDANV